MKLITRFEVAALTKGQLHDLYKKVFYEFAQSKPHTAEHSNALASLENIRREFGLRMGE